jgi:acyl-CoA reductase-like NAD-dependent aldehyde dehydrogenase
MTVSTPVLLQHLIAGQWITGSGDELRSVNPARPQVLVAQGSSATIEDLDAAVAAAVHARAGWAATPIHQRGAVLLAAADVIERNADDWGLDLAAEEGKTKAEGVAEVRRAAQILRYYGNEGDRQAGEIYASPRAGEQILVTRKPVGVIGVITPFNFPIAIPAWKIAPALIYGNTVVWKPASTVPMLSMRLASALTAAGLPAGVLNILIGGSHLGDGIVNHPEVDAVTFTGSTGIGRRIAAAAAERGVPAQCEMGGKNAAVVLDDADVELAVEQVMLGAFRSTGQKCTATSRLILTPGIADRFLDELTARAQALTVGDPADDVTQMGPVVSDSAHKTIAIGIETARSQGAAVLAGGHPYSDGPCRGGTSSHRPSSSSPISRPISGPTNCSALCWRCGAPPMPKRPLRWPTTVSSDSRQRCSPRTSAAHCKPSSSSMSVCCTSIPNPQAPTPTCPSAAPRRAAWAPRNKVPRPASSSRTPPRCTCAAGRCGHEHPKTSASEDRSEARVPEDDRE